MGGSKHAPLHFKRSLKQRLRLGILALVAQGNGQIARTRERARMLGSQHARLYGKHLSGDLLRVSMLLLV